MSNWPTVPALTARRVVSMAKLPFPCFNFVAVGVSVVVVVTGGDNAPLSSREKYAITGLSLSSLPSETSTSTSRYPKRS
eukprot:CAMPEP_0196155214 /NCGR_PEP_ID=MMETSP0910-20130528/40232_1 /TAXON_ID=49265 /ORGANISM="Thalassiosira rotula, Strain GSO102" /LENGTH=78 /DNA_ID=CAMNT_0041419385 /DNA_START=17 /DNA_END=253 /DNA_ORIENTATION=+